MVSDLTQNQEDQVTLTRAKLADELDSCRSLVSCVMDGRLRSVDICDWSMDGLNWLPRADDPSLMIGDEHHLVCCFHDRRANTDSSRARQQTHT